MNRALPLRADPRAKSTNRAEAGPMEGTGGADAGCGLLGQAALAIVFKEIAMNDRIASAVFDSRAEAENALSELRAAGAQDSAISIIARQEGSTSATDGAGEDLNKSGALKGALIGGGAGTLLGIAALAIPGVGPLAAAGAIAASAIPEAAAIGAAAGATAGGLSGLLTKHGVSDEDARYYEERINSGGFFVSVTAEDGGLSIERAREILYHHGGHSTSRARMTA
jgi:hypothetical protein